MVVLLRLLDNNVEKIQKIIFIEILVWRIQPFKKPIPPIIAGSSLKFRSPCSSINESKIYGIYGDRNFRDDPAMIGGIGFLNGRAVTVIGQQRGKDTKDVVP
jgi:hypothetical protein